LEINFCDAVGIRLQQFSNRIASVDNFLVHGVQR
jgi:hypothetical protein